MRLHFKLASATFAALLSVSAIPAAAQQNYKPSYSEEGDAALMAQFLGDPEHQTLMSKAKAGDPYAMLKMERAASIQLTPNLFNKTPALEMRMKLLVGAIGENYAPAFARMGDIIVRERAIPGATAVDAFGYYVQGAKAGDKDSTVQAIKLATDPFSCSTCTRDSSGGLNLPLPPAKALDLDEMDKAGALYIAEKQEMATALIAALEETYKPEHGLNSEALIRFYLEGIEMPLSRYYSREEGQLFAPNGQKAEALLKAMVGADPSSSYAPSLLGMYYANPRKSGIARSSANFLKYMDLGAKAGDEGAAKTAQILGHEMVTGKIVPADVPRAITYLELADKAGNADASYDLGLLNLLGKNIPVNNTKAQFYFRQAMDRKHADGARALAQMFREGTAHKQSDLLADEYMRRAAEFEKAEPKCDDSNLMAVDCLVKYGSK